MLSEEERKARLAFWIGEIRRQRKLSPPKLAALVGVSRSTINKWESVGQKRQVPSLIWLGPLASALRVDPRLFADLPPIPPSAAAEYLVSDVVAEGLEEGLREDRRRQRRGGRPVPPGSPPSPDDEVDPGSR